MGSRRGKEGLLLAVFWVVAIALIGTAANRLILHGPLGGTLQKKETGRMLMELSVLFLWNLWWLCLAVKSREKRGLAIACLIPGWLLFLWGHRILIPLIGLVCGWERWLDMAFASTTVFWKILEEKTKLFFLSGRRSFWG